VKKRGSGLRDGENCRELLDGEITGLMRQQQQHQLATAVCSAVLSDAVID